jgi:hypothetical protein
MPASPKSVSLLMHATAAVGMVVVLGLVILTTGNSEQSLPAQASAETLVRTPGQAPTRSAPQATAASPIASAVRPTPTLAAASQTAVATRQATTGQVAFAIVDRLGTGQTADHVEVRAAGKVVATLDLDTAHPAATTHLTASKAGRYAFTLDATTTVTYRGQPRRIQTHGETSVDIANGTELEVVVDGDYVDANGNLLSPPTLSLRTN